MKHSLGRTKPIPVWELQTVAPIIVGGETSAFPSEVRLSLDLLDERRFGNGMVYLHYETTRR